MAFGKGCISVSLADILNKVSEFDIASYYLNIDKIPCIINSPLRKDATPSFGLYSMDGKRIFYYDFASKDKGGLFDLLGKLWKVAYIQVLERIYKEVIPKNNDIKISKSNHSSNNTNNILGVKLDVSLSVKLREWRDYDFQYWSSYGISEYWLKLAEVHPISHKIITKNNKKFVFAADKYAYCFIERKENKIGLKIYQPLNTKGYKWQSSTDKSVWSLWTKIPKTGESLFIASSLKDCLNLWANTGIPAICLQGEGYVPKPHVIQELKERFKKIIVFYDNDYSKEHNTGRENSLTLAKKYDLYRIEIPEMYEAKDPSDLFKKYGKIKYKEIITKILEPLWNQEKSQ